MRWVFKIHRLLYINFCFKKKINNFEHILKSREFPSNIIQYLNALISHKNIHFYTTINFSIFLFIIDLIIRMSNNNRTRSSINSSGNLPLPLMYPINSQPPIIRANGGQYFMVQPPQFLPQPNLLRPVLIQMNPQNNMVIRPPLPPSHPINQTVYKFPTSISSLKNTENIMKPELNIEISHNQCTSNQQLFALSELEEVSTTEKEEDRTMPNCVPYISTEKAKTIKNAPSLAYINEKAHEIRVNLSESGKYVEWSDIITELLTKYNCKSISELGFKRSDQLETIKDLLYTQKSIDTFLVYYDNVMPYSTTYELENQLAKYFKKTYFSELHVGPLCANKNVKAIFDLPDGTEKFPPIKFKDIFTKLEKFLSKTDSWSKRVDLEDFKDYFAKEYNVDEIRKLGVNLLNLTPLIRALKNVKRLHKECVLETEVNFKNELMEKFNNHQQWLTQRIDEKLRYLCSSNEKSYFEDLTALSTRNMYANLKPFEAIELLLKEFGDSIDSRYSNKINQFIFSLKKDEYLQKLFHLGLCFSKFSITECLKNLKLQPGMVLFADSSSFYIFLRDFFRAFIFRFLKTDETENLLNRIFYDKKEQIRIEAIGKENNSFAAKNQSNASTSDNRSSFILKDKPTRHETVCQMKNILNKNFSILTLQSLSKIEEKLISQYNCQEFSNLGFGSLTQFLSRNDELLEDSGAFISTNKKSAKHLATQKKHFVNHLKQLIKNYQEKNASLVERLLLDFYSVSNINDLGFGSFNHLVSTIENVDENADISPRVIYEDSILDETCSKISETNFEQDRDTIVKLVEECPVLENLIEYTKWNSYYSSKYGDIKEFISSQDEIYALQIRHGLLLKLNAKADIERLNEFIKNGSSIEAAGELVSLISVKYGSLKLAPVKLIQNYLEMAFVEYAAICQKNKKNSINSSFSNFYSFIVDFISRLPLKFASNCIHLFFIETLSKLEGSPVSVKEKIYKQCSMYDDDSKLKFLHNLSLSSNINEWSKQRALNVQKERRVQLPRMIIFDEAEVSEQVVAEKRIDEKPVTVSSFSETSNIVDDFVSKVEETKPEVNETCKQHIDKIRRETFGADLVSNDENKLVIDKLKGVIGRSLERLSKDLYNEDIHFVLELIQNADDNQYESFLDPSLVILIEDDKIVLLNNENGFMRENIEAICNVGGSTKKKREQGYIGRKGIGFKSVFTITNSPLIHSNGYHIKFDISNGDSIGYILPLFCTESEINDNLSVKRVLNEKLKLEENFGKMNTSICLPLKETTEAQHEVLMSSFAEIKHSLLLFLNRLRNLVIVRKIEKENAAKSELIHCIYQRRDISENIIEIHAGFTISTWLLNRQRFRVPDKIKPNDSIESTEVSLAFPVKNSHSETDDDDFTTPMEKYETYAYLPLKNFGFSFIIQADFDVPANRQDIKHDNRWNQLLIEKIPELFVNSLAIFKSYKPFKNNFNAVKHFIRFIPLEEEIYHIFKNTVRQIYTALRDVEFLPVLRNGKIEYKKPIECVVIKEPAIREILTPEMVYDYLGRFFIHDSLCNDDVNSKILFNLGVRSVSTKDILHALKKLMDSDREKFLNSTYTAKWLVALKRCLDNSSIDDEDYFFSQLKKLKFIPLATGGDCVSLDECNVFFPEIIKIKKNVNKTSKMTSLVFNSLISDLNIINIGPLICLDDKCNENILSLLRDLGVMYIDEKNVIEMHILKQLNDKTITSKKSKSTLISYVMCLFDYWRKTDESLDLKSLELIIPLLTNQEFKTPRETQICFTRNYGNEFDILNDFPGYDWCLLSEVYLKESKKIENQQKINENLNKFFREIGVTDFYLFEKKKIVLTVDELVNSKFSLYAEILQKLKPDEVYIFNDYVSPVFDYYLDEIKNGKINTDKLFKIFENLFLLIENNWKKAKNLNEPIRSFTRVSVSICKKTAVDEDNNKPFNPELCESQFYKKLREEKWIVGNLEENNVGMSFYRPNELFIENDEIKSFYGVKVPYLAVKNNSLLVNELSIVSKFETNMFLEKFKTWCELNDLSAEYNFDQLYYIYQFLAQQLKTRSNPLIQELFENQPFIFIPTNRVKTKNSNNFNGKFHHPKDVYCSEITGLFEKYKSEISSCFLNKYYAKVFKNEYPQIFCELGVPLNPTLEMYVDLLFDIQRATQSDNINYDEAVRDLFNLFHFFIQQFQGDMNALKSCLQNLFDNKSIWPCLTKKWVSSAESPLIIDDAELAIKFIDKLHFLTIPSNSGIKQYQDDDILQKLSIEQSNYENLKFNDSVMDSFLLNVCDLKTVSSVIVPNVETITYNLRAAPAIQNLCRKVLLYIQCFLAHKNDYKGVYKQCLEAKYDELLPKMKFYSVKSLDTVFYYIDDNTINTVITKTSLFKKNQNGNLEYFVSVDIMDNEKEVLIGFIDCFISKEPWLKIELSKFIKLIHPFIKTELNYKDKLEIEKDHGIRLELSNENPWVINEAQEIIKPPVVVPPVTVDANETDKPASTRRYVKIDLNQQRVPEQDHVIEFTETNNNSYPIPNNSGPVLKVEVDVKMESKIDPETLAKLYIDNSPESTKIEEISKCDQKPETESKNHDQHKIGFLKTTETSEENQKSNSDERIHHSQNFEPNINREPTNGKLKPYNEEGRIKSLIDIEALKNIKLPEIYELVELENINWSDKLKQFNYKIDESGADDSKLIGYYGELWVYEMLKQKYEEKIKKNLVELIWLNENSEQGTPYDLKIVDRTDNTEKYIEVKSTTGHTKEHFSVSIQQLLFAEQKQSSFIIYRLFNVNNGNPEKVECRIIKNVIDKMNMHAVKVFMII